MKLLYILKTAALTAPKSLGGPADFGALAKTITNLLLSVAGIVSVIFIIVGGIMYSTSAGNSDQTSKAKSTITNAIIGLVISLLAFAIVNFLISDIFK